MKLLDVVLSPWAIARPNLEEIIGIYSTHLRGDFIDVRALEARLGRSLQNERKPYEVIDGVAIIDLEGVLAPKMNLLMEVSGGTSTQIAQLEIESAAADPSVRGIIPRIDSPGGVVTGIPELAAAIRRAGEVKPVVAWAEGTMASGAYWAGSAAHKVFISGSANEIGSVGVVIAHRDTSEANRQAGIKITEITSGRYKRIASSNAPLTEEGRATLQERTDYIYSLFVNAVAEHRGTTAEAVLERMADGRIFHGQQAIDAGLVDGVSTLAELIDALNGGAYSPTPRRAGVAHFLPPVESKGQHMPPDQQQQTPAAPMTRETLEASQPALFAQLRNTFRAEGATAERERVTAIRALALPGHEAVIEKAIAEGVSADAAAGELVRAQQATLRNAAREHANDAPEAVNGSATGADPKRGSVDKTKEQQRDEARAYQKEHPGVEFIDALKALGYA